MSNLDELLIEAESLQDNSDWEPMADYETIEDYVDDEESAEVVGREIKSIDQHISVEGEINSQYIGFMMPRYVDGIDVSEMNLIVHYELPDGTGSNDYPINAFKNDTQIKFGWLVPSAATKEDAKIEICIAAIGKVGDKSYTFKTKPISYKVNRGLDLDTGIPEPDEDWYIHFVYRLTEEVNAIVNKAEEDVKKIVKDAISWDAINNKPFETLSPESFEVVGGVLKVIGGSSSSAEVTAISNVSPLERTSDSRIRSILLKGNSYKSKNKFNPEAPVTLDGYSYKYEIKVEPNKQYIATTNIPAEETADIYIGTYSGAYRIDKNTNRVTLTDSNVLNVWIRHSNTSSGTNYYEKIKDGTYWLNIEEGSTATPYEPYGIINPSGDVETHNEDNTESSLAHTDRPLISVNEIRNELIINPDGTGKFIERVKRINLVTLSWSKVTDYTFEASISDIKVLSTRMAKILCSKYEEKINGEPFDSSWDKVIFGLTPSKIRVIDNSYNDESSFKNSLSDASLIYELVTPITTDLSPVEVDELLSLKTFDSTTYINTDGCPFEIGYYNNSNAGKNAAEVADKLKTVSISSKDFEGSVAGNIRSIKLVGNSRKSKNLFSWDKKADIFSNNRSTTTHSISDGVLSINTDDTTTSGVYIISNIINQMLNAYDGKTITLSAEIKSNNSDRINLGFDHSRTAFNITSEYKKYSHTLVWDKSKTNNNMNFYSIDGIQNTIYVKNIQLEEGSVATDYEPYGIISPSGNVESKGVESNESSLVHTDRPLLSVNEIKNELIINEDGSGQFIERVSKTTFNKDSFWAVGATSGNIINIASTKPTDMKTNGQTLSSEFTCVVGGAINFQIPTTLGITTVDGWKSYLGNNIITVLYEVDNPLTYTLSPTEVSELLSLKTYNGKTYINTDGAPFEISYFRNSPLAVIDTKVDEIRADVTQIIEDVENRGFYSVNLVDGIENGAISVTLQDSASTARARAKNIIDTNPSETFTISCKASGGKTIQVAVNEVKADGTALVNTSWQNVPYVHTVDSQASKFRFFFRCSDNTVYPENYISDVQCERGTKVTNYMPHVPSNTELNESLAQLAEVKSGSVTNLSSVATTYRMRLKKSGNVVCLSFYFALNAIPENLTDWYDLFQLPTGFFNTDNHLDFVMSDFDKNTYQAMVSTTGLVRFVPKAVIQQGRLAIINLTYILG